MTDRITLNDQDFDKAVQKTVRVLSEGGIVLYPTETVYGLGADAENQEAVRKIYQIKERKDEKVLILCTRPEMYVEMNEEAEKLAKAFWPGPLSLVLKKRDDAPATFFPNLTTKGIRNPSHPFCQAIATAFARGITSTSANKAGEQPEHNPDAILASLGDEASMIDLVIDAGELEPKAPSTVVGLSKGELEVFRVGAIPLEEIKRVLE